MPWHRPKQQAGPLTGQQPALARGDRSLLPVLAPRLAGPCRGAAQPAGRCRLLLATQIVQRQLDKYRDQLFGHPAAWPDDGREVRIVVRTNHSAEPFFSGAKHALLRRMGREHPDRDIQDHPAEACLAANLANPDYVRIVCDATLENLPLQFATLVRSGTGTA